MVSKRRQGASLRKDTMNGMNSLDHMDAMDEVVLSAGKRETGILLGRRRWDVLSGVAAILTGSRGFADAYVKHFDGKGKPESEVDIAFVDLLVETFKDEHDTDKEKEGEGEDLDRWMAFDEPPDSGGVEHHDENRHDNGGNHDVEVVGHPDGGNDGIKREDDIQEHDLDKDKHEGGGGAAGDG